MRAGYLRKRIGAENVRSFVFGVEDSLVSTAGFVTGVAVAGASASSILVSGTVLVAVEAFSMGLGAFLSENSVEEYEAQHAVSWGRSAVSAAVMFVSYLASGLLILMPYALLESDSALAVSIAASLLTLFLLGAMSALLSRGNMLRKGLVMLAAGGAAIAMGSAIGAYFGVR